MVTESALYYYLGQSYYDSTYYGKDGLRVGRVEICVNGSYGTLCDYLWDNNDASVVCGQVGYSIYGKI